MQEVVYKLHTYKDANYPIIFKYIHNKNKYQVTTHWHLDIELLYIQSGTIKVHFESECVSAIRGDIIIINTNELHRIESVTQESFYYSLILDVGFCQDLGFDVLNTKYNTKTRDLEMKNIFQLIVNEGVQYKDYFEKAIRALCNTMLILMHRNQINNEKVYIDRKSKTENIYTVKRMINFIFMNFSETITLDDLSKHVAVSKFHMTRIFKEFTKLTVNRFLIQIRLDNAQKLLCKSNDNITDIAHTCGFKSLSYFTKSYKEHFGVAPSEYRNQSKFDYTRSNDILLVERYM